MSSNRRLTTLKCLLILSIVAILILIGVRPASVSAESALPYLELVRPDRGRVFAVTWSPHGSYVAVGTDTGLWIYTDTLADVLHVPDEPIHALAWSPDGTTIATGYFGKEGQYDTKARTTPLKGGGIRLWGVQESNHRLALTQHPKIFSDGSVYSTRFNPNGSTLAVLSQDDHFWADFPHGDDSLHLYDILAGSMIDTFTGSSTDFVQNNMVTQGANALSWTHDGRYLTTARFFNPGNRLTTWDSLSDHFTATLYDKPLTKDEDDGAVMAVDWNSNNDLLASNSQTRPILPDGLLDEGVIICGLLNEDTGIDSYGGVSDSCQPLPVLTVAHRSGYFDFNSVRLQVVAWQPHGNWLAYDSFTTIRIWDAKTQQLVADLDAARDSIMMLEWSPDGTKLLSSGSDDAVRIWTKFENYMSPDPKPVHQTMLPALSRYSSISPNGQYFATYENQSNPKRQLNIFNVSDGSLKAVFELPQFEVGYINVPDQVFWRPQSDILYVQDSSQNFDTKVAPVFLSVDSRRVSNSFHLNQDHIDFPVWRPDGNAFGTTMGVIDAHTGKTIISHTDPNNEDLARFGFEEHDCCSNAHDFIAALWSPDGRFLATSDYQGGGIYDSAYVIIWDTVTNRFANIIQVPRTTDDGGSGGGATPVAWSPDGKTLVLEGYYTIYFYHMSLQGNYLSAKMLFSRSLEDNIYQSSFSSTQVVFSPDGRYFLFGGTIWDSQTGWPVFRFRATTIYDDFRWVGDQLIAYAWNAPYTNPTDPDREIYPSAEAFVFRTSDFLPKP